LLSVAETHAKGLSRARSSASGRVARRPGGLRDHTCLTHSPESGRASPCPSEMELGPARIALANKETAAMARAPLYDASIDGPARAKAPKGGRPILVTSIVEVFALNAIAFFIAACHLDGFAESPREEEWFSWAPEAARPWLLTLAFAVT